MRPSLWVTRVHWRQKACLERMYQEARCPRFRIRVQMVLLSLGGKSAEEIAKIVRHSDDTVRRWLRRFMDEGCDGLIERAHTGRPAQVTEPMECFLMTCIRQTPRQMRKSGEDRPTWTTKLLASMVEARFGVRVTDECIRRHLEGLGAVCRRPTWTVKHLAERQPGYAQKKARLPGCCDVHRVRQMCMCRMRLK